jgi:prepilin-type processing-associated H-X9-DG protein
MHDGGAFFAFADGHVRFLPEDLHSDLLRALVTRSGQETMGEF